MSNMTFRRLAALAALAFALPFGVVAMSAAQTPTDTLGDYTQTVQPETVQTQETQETLPSEQTGEPEEEEGGTTPASPSSGTPAPPGSTPPALAFTGFEAGLVAGFGLLLIGAAVALQRRRAS